MSGAAVAPGLSFPDASRSYEAKRGAVHFWGHDRSMEVSFYVTAAALKQLEPRLQSDENGFLRAFDANRTRIEGIAAKLYRAQLKQSYEIDFNNLS